MSDQRTPADESSGDRPGVAPAYRLSDQERDEAIAALAQAYAEGRLTVAEFEDRMTQAGSARFATELDPLFADLPGRARTRATDRALPRARRGRAGAVTGDSLPTGWGQPRPRRPSALVPLLAIALGAMIVTGHFWVLFPVLFLGAHLSRSMSGWAGCHSHARGPQRR